MRRAFTALLILTLTACVPNTRYTVHEDNDYFSPHTNDDRDFTQGIRFSGDHADDSGSTEYSVGQNAYTPGHKQLTTPQPNDRPYAALLYGSADFRYRVSPESQNAIGVTAGIVGPHAYGEQIQNGFHRLIQQNTAKGWDTQIHDEPALMLTLEHQHALPITQSLDIIGTIGADLGNIYTQGYTGFLVHFGYNLPPAFDYSNVIYPRVERGFTVKENWRAYLFAGPYGRAVVRDIFLDGNTFRNSASIGKKTFVAEGRLGAAVEHKQYRLAYTYIVQTAEFDGQPNGNDFAEVSFSWEW